LTTLFTWSTFHVSFLRAWGEADEAQTTKDKLKHMKQKGACSTYITEFDHYALLAQFDELALKETLLGWIEGRGQGPPPNGS
jgi:hypothetical protein